MSNHPNWHDQQGQYAAQHPPRHHPNMDPYAGPSPSSQQGAPYSNAPHAGTYPQAHLPPPVSRQSQQQQWSSGTSQDFGGPSPSNSAPRSSGHYVSGFDAPPPSIGSTNSPMRQHGAHASPYASQSPYPPSHGGPSDPQGHLTARGGMPPQYDYANTHAPQGYAHPHHPSSQSQSQQHQPPPPPQGPPQAPAPHHPSHPSQQQQQPQHWNAAPLPSVLQPQSMAPASGPAGALNRVGPPSHAMDRPFGVSKQEDDGEDDDNGGYDDYDSKGKARAGDAAQTANKGTSDFVKKLFSMLDDKAYESVVAWSPSGESFIVKDMNDFTKHVLPRNFRHSNFASFVRQLNKYDFHKVKNPEDGSGTVGEHVWEFQHPDFVRGREDLLENVKRKIPAKKKSNLKGVLGVGADGERDDSPSMSLQGLDNSGMGGSGAIEKSAEYADLKAQIVNLTAVQDQMQNHILALTKQYQGVIGEMLTFQRNMVQQDQLMQNLIQYLMNLEQDRPVDGGGASSFLPQTHEGNNQATLAGQGSFLAPAGVNTSSYEDPSSSFTQLSDMRRANDAALNKVTADASTSGSVGSSSNTNPATVSSTRMSGMASAPSTAAPLSPKSVASPMDSNNTGKTPEMSHQHNSNSSNNGCNNGNSALAPMILHHPPSQVSADETEPSRNSNRSNTTANGVSSSNLNSNSGPPKSSNSSISSRPELPKKLSTSSTTSSLTTPTGEPNNYLRVRRSTLVPGWAVPPRVLLVDDDQVCRRLSSKFLQVFGCTIDYAVDGMSAVNKMNSEKYDLVLMDIVMPNLDGASATSLIRQFDPKTPIISMTSNSGPSELINYMSSGMTDILPKPFTKEGLLNMLEKHLLHLKAVQREHRQSGDMGQVQNVIRNSVSLSSPLPNNTGSTPNNNNGTSFSNGGAGENGSNPAGAGAGAAAGGEGGGEGSLNPLAGMGFTDEEYVAMLQNLISAGTDDDLGPINYSNNDAGANAGGGMGSKDNTPGRSPFANPNVAPGAGYKRSASSSAQDGMPPHHHHQQQLSNEANKRGRFGEIS